MTHLFNTSQKQSYYRDPPAFRDTMDLMRQTLKTISVCDPLHQALYLYCQSWLVDDLLAKADRMTMAHSLELRVPFLDHELVEWLARTPSWVKVDPHPPKGIPATKRLLRDYARGRLPESILTRPKKGFPVPAYDWLDGPLKSWAEGLLNSQETRSTRYFSPLSLQTLLRQATDSRATGLMRHRLWQFLILELWMRRWKV